MFKQQPTSAVSQSVSRTKYGSIAGVERLIRTIKSECTRKLTVPYQRESFRRELSLFVIWYVAHRHRSRA